MESSFRRSRPAMRGVTGPRLRSTGREPEEETEEVRPRRSPPSRASLDADPVLGLRPYTHLQGTAAVGFWKGSGVGGDLQDFGSGAVVLSVNFRQSYCQTGLLK